MPLNLSIKEVPDALAQRLRWRAEQNHRSLQGELMAIIEAAAAEATLAPTAAQRGVHPLPAALPRGSKTIEEIAAAHKLRFATPIHTGPMAVDIVRADRDAR